MCREKLLKYDAKRREYDVVVIGEEPHLAYNRVGLTSFFQHREVENLYLNPKDWVGDLNWTTAARLTTISTPPCPKAH
jgi:nitrite reductase (NAD(P)H)